MNFHVVMWGLVPFNTPVPKLIQTPLDHCPQPLCIGLDRARTHPRSQLTPRLTGREPGLSPRFGKTPKPLPPSHNCPQLQGYACPIHFAIGQLDRWASFSTNPGPWQTLHDKRKAPDTGLLGRQDLNPVVTTMQPFMEITPRNMGRGRRVKSLQLP